jgi:multidrug efflux pump subunit AcrA (membrane-fusion protein)
LFQRQLLPQQTLDDAEAKYQSAQAALDLARAQNTQSQSRLDELRITQQNTIITSPVNGFVARRVVDPGAFVSPKLSGRRGRRHHPRTARGEHHREGLEADRRRRYRACGSGCVSGRGLHGTDRASFTGARSSDADSAHRSRNLEPHSTV